LLIMGGAITMMAGAVANSCFYSREGNCRNAAGKSSSRCAFRLNLAVASRTYKL
jgi:hypothetical protein